jgi:HSP20 family protein
MERNGRMQRISSNQPLEPTTKQPDIVVLDLNNKQLKGVIMRLVRRPKSEMPLSRLRDQLDQMFEPDFTISDFLGGGWTPAVDVLEGKDKLTVKAELPGFKREDLDVSVHENNLIISGERKSEDERREGDFYRSERFYGKFHRSISLPATVETGKIEARYRDGVLTVTLPKSEHAKAKQIEVNVE